MIYETFPNSESLKMKIPDLYKIFSKNTNFQMIYLTEILIEGILLDKGITLEEKINYLYCLGRHYQNTAGKGINLTTVDYIFSYIYKIYGWVNAVPYSKVGKGEILSGIIYAHELKIKE